jgi:HSP20 family protein
MFGRLTYSENPLFADFRRLEQELEQIFGDSTPWTGGIRSLPAGTFPAVNVGSTGDSVTVYLFAPGLDPKSLDISLQQSMLSISGQRDVPVDASATYYRQERFSGAFRRTIGLPEDVDPDQVEAKYRDGIVQITMRRRESTKPRQIEIH